MLRGAGRFVDDIPHPFAFHVAFARSPVAAGTIAGIDVTAASGMPGVVTVFTSEDLGHPALTAALGSARVRVNRDASAGSRPGPVRGGTDRGGRRGGSLPR